MRVIAALALAAATLGGCAFFDDDPDNDQPRAPWDGCQSFLCEVFQERDDQDTPGG